MEIPEATNTFRLSFSCITGSAETAVDSNNGSFVSRENAVRCILPVDQTRGSAIYGNTCCTLKQKLAVADYRCDGAERLPCGQWVNKRDGGPSAGKIIVVTKIREGIVAATAMSRQDEHYE